MVDYTLSGCYVDQKSIQVVPPCKLKISLGGFSLSDICSTMRSLINRWTLVVLWTLEVQQIPWMPLTLVMICVTLTHEECLWVEHLEEAVNITIQEKQHCDSYIETKCTTLPCSPLSGIFYTSNHLGLQMLPYSHCLSSGQCTVEHCTSMGHPEDSGPIWPGPDTNPFTMPGPGSGWV